MIFGLSEEYSKLAFQIQKKKIWKLGQILVHFNVALGKSKFAVMETSRGKNDDARRTPQITTFNHWSEEEK